MAVGFVGLAAVQSAGKNALPAPQRDASECTKHTKIAPFSRLSRGCNLTEKTIDQPLIIFGKKCAVEDALV